MTPSAPGARRLLSSRRIALSSSKLAQLLRRPAKLGSLPEGRPTPPTHRPVKLILPSAVRGIAGAGAAGRAAAAAGAPAPAGAPAAAGAAGAAGAAAA